MHRLSLLTWHVHGAYLYYLAHVPHEIFVPVREGRPDGYVGLPFGGHPWPSNLHEVRAEDVKRLELDCVVTQTHAQWLEDRHELLTAEQLALPRIHVEHDPPREHPVDQLHPVDDPDALLVHVTNFNALMWESGRTPVRVIEHGVTVPAGVNYSGELARGLVVVNNLGSRGRRVGADVFARVRDEIPLDLAGMGSEELEGLGDIPHDRLPAVQARYRFLFNPIRYTSLGLAVCEAMLLGMPVVALATTEYATTIVNGVSGYADTRVDVLIARMRELLADPAAARRLGEGARRLAQERFALARFVRDWDDALRLVTS